MYIINVNKHNLANHWKINVKLLNQRSKIKVGDFLKEQKFEDLKMNKKQPQ